MKLTNDVWFKNVEGGYNVTSNYKSGAGFSKAVVTLRFSTGFTGTALLVVDKHSISNVFSQYAVGLRFNC